MPTIYHLRDGAPPNNVTNVYEVDTEFIKENFETAKLKYLVSLTNKLPVFNIENGPANQYSAPKYIILEIHPKDVESLAIEMSGFYIVDGVSPSD